MASTVREKSGSLCFSEKVFWMMSVEKGFCHFLLIQWKERDMIVFFFSWLHALFWHSALFCCKMFLVNKCFMRYPASTRALKRRCFFALELLVHEREDSLELYLRLWNKHTLQNSFISGDVLC